MKKISNKIYNLNIIYYKKFLKILIYMLYKLKNGI